MKIVITTSGSDLNAPVDSRFGRAPTFLIYDTETTKYTLAYNQQNMNASQGAGIQSAQTVASTGATALITGHCGPKAFRVLSAANIKVYTTTAATIAEALALYREGKLTESVAADVEGHW
jgi:predicted Fe-Mo cluster-binding NifX family protein